MQFGEKFQLRAQNPSLADYNPPLSLDSGKRFDDKEPARQEIVKEALFMDS
jgi:hypothetical protein